MLIAKDALVAAQRDLAVVKIARQRIRPDVSPLYGFVVDVSDELCLLNVISDRIDLDGFEVIRVADVTNVDTDFGRARFFQDALRLKGLSRQEPAGLSVGTLPETLKRINELYPLFVLYRERTAPKEVAIGCASKWLKSGVRLRWITPSAQWVPDQTLYRFASITRVGFGGEYEMTLAKVALQST